MPRVPASSGFGNLPQRLAHSTAHKARTVKSRLDRRGPDELNGAIWTWIAIGTTLMIVGILLFVNVQAQEIFRQAGDEVGDSRLTRNDGGLAIFAAISGIGLAVVLGSLSRRAFIERFGPMTGLATATTALLVMHFAIYVSGFTIPGTSVTSISASFLFKDANNMMPIAVFVVALTTLVLLYAAASASMALLIPQTRESHFRHPTALTQHRTRTVLTALVFVTAGVAFARQFLLYALDNDADPSGTFPITNLVFVYYLLVISLTGVVGLTAFRTYTSTWGDLRDKRSRSYRRAHAYMLNAETWLWGIMGLLTAAIALSDPISQPRQVDRVFAMDSKGVSLFFFVAFGLYVLHRRCARSYLEHLYQLIATRPNHTLHTGYDALFWMSASTVAAWALTALAFVATDASPLTKLTIRTAIVAMIMPFFAIRFDFHDLERPGLRDGGSPMVLLFSALLSILAGLMLWGTGNSVTTIYSAESGGFITPEDSVLQPYAVGIRILGSLFIATPVSLALWYMATRFQHPFRPGPLIVVAFSVILGMNTLLTISAGGEYDAALRQTEVIIGFSFVALADAATKVSLMLGWAAVAGIGIIAAALLFHRGTDDPDEKLTRLWGADA